MTYQPIPGVLVLGLGHKARHGKDTCAQAMLAAAPNDVVRIGFADALYDYCRIQHGMKEKDPTLLQHVGVSMRARNPQAWVNAVYWKIVDRKPKVVVIPDVRFPNELGFIKQMGGYTIKVERRGENDEPFVADDRDPNHISETALDDYTWDLVITNRFRYQHQTERNAVIALNFYRTKQALESAPAGVVLDVQA